MKVQVEEYRHKLIEKISETDDVLLDKYLGGEEPNVEELRAALRRAVIAYKLVPIYAGTSLRNKGVQPLLDAVVEYLPSPVDLKEVKGIKVYIDGKEMHSMGKDNLKIPSVLARSNFRKVIFL
jgi:elongation factor G